MESGQYEANLLSLPEMQRRQLLEGDWGVADGAAFPEFRQKITLLNHMIFRLIGPDSGHVIMAILVLAQFIGLLLTLHMTP